MSSAQVRLHKVERAQEAFGCGDAGSAHRGVDSTGTVQEVAVGRESRGHVRQKKETDHCQAG
jgi:hypothetical protein